MHQEALYNEYEITKLVCDSANGMIYSGLHKATNQKVIFKQIPRNTVCAWAKLDDCWVPSEIYYHFVAASHDHYNVIASPITWFEKRSSFVLVLEEVENATDLFYFVERSDGPVDEKDAANIFGQILQMLVVLKEAGISHRDIKDENIIVNQSTLECKLIDFGCATADLDGEQDEFSGTPEFYPPEFWKRRTYHHDTLNIYAAGLVLHILLRGGLPFRDRQAVAKFDVSEIDLSAMSSRAKRIILSTIAHRPEDRATLVELERMHTFWSLSL